MGENEFDDADSPNLNSGIRYADQDEADLVNQLNALRAGRANVFFYPNAALDWTPLYRLTHLADLFVYVDSRITENRFDSAFKVIRNRETDARGGLESLQVGNPDYTNPLEREVLPAAVQETLDWVWEGTPRVEPWVTAKLLGRNIGERKRRHWLIYIGGGSPITAYQRLFAERKIAPRCFCLRQLVDVDTPDEAMATYNQRNAAWTNTAQWNGPLGQMIQNSDARPEFLVGDCWQFGWPHKFVRQQMYNWQVHNPPDNFARGICGLPGASWPDLAPTQAQTERRVVVTRRPVDPLFAKGVDAVVVAPDCYRRYKWPDHLTIILNAQPQDPDQPIPGDQRVIVRQIKGRPLAEALQSIEQVAEERNLSRVAVQCLGFEDEGEFLLEWRQCSGVIKELSFHVHSDGRFLDFAPYANECD